MKIICAHYILIIILLDIFIEFYLAFNAENDGTIKIEGLRLKYCNLKLDNFIIIIKPII